MKPFDIYYDYIEKTNDVFIEKLNEILAELPDFMDVLEEEAKDKPITFEGEYDYQEINIRKVNKNQDLEYHFSGIDNFDIDKYQSFIIIDRYVNNDIYAVAFNENEFIFTNRNINHIEEISAIHIQNNKFIKNTYFEKYYILLILSILLETTFDYELD